MYQYRTAPILIAAALLLFGCSGSGERSDRQASTIDLSGAWRVRIQFTSGPFASVKDLEFMYVFNVGGTLTESSNYDAAPPVPPAYGVWKPIGDRQYVAHYEFYATRPPDSTEHAAGGTGWLPAGHGELTDSILLSVDGRTFMSRTHFEMIDQAGNKVEGGGEATGQGSRIEF